MSDEYPEFDNVSDDGDTTLRDKPQNSEGTVEISSADIEPLDPSEGQESSVAESVDEESTQLIELGRLEQSVAEDVSEEADAELRTTSEIQTDDVQAHEEATSAYRVPQELLDATRDTGEPSDYKATTELPTASDTQKMEAVSVPEETVERSIVDDWVEVDEQGWHTFVTRAGEDGHVTLPKEVVEALVGSEETALLIKVKKFGGE